MMIGDVLLCVWVSVVDVSSLGLLLGRDFLDSIGACWPAEHSTGETATDRCRSLCAAAGTIDLDFTRCAPLAQSWPRWCGWDSSFSSRIFAAKIDSTCCFRKSWAWTFGDWAELQSCWLVTLWTGGETSWCRFAKFGLHGSRHDAFAAINFFDNIAYDQIPSVQLSWPSSTTKWSFPARQEHGWQDGQEWFKDCSCAPHGTRMDCSCGYCHGPICATCQFRTNRWKIWCNGSPNVRLWPLRVAFPRGIWPEPSNWMPSPWATWPSWKPSATEWACASHFWKILYYKAWWQQSLQKEWLLDWNEKQHWKLNN